MFLITCHNYLRPIIKNRLYIPIFEKKTCNIIINKTDYIFITDDFSSSEIKYT